MTTSLTRTLRAVAGALLLLAAAAAAAEAPRQYEIELLVFRNLVANDGGEVWRDDYSDWFETGEDTDGLPLATVDWLDPSTWRLARHEAALRSSAGYRPIAHFAWRQSVLDRARAQPVALPVTGRQAGSAWIDGTARVAVERYLHLYLDLQLHLPQAGGGTDTELSPYREPRINLTQQRRMRSKELHYFDNPRFGVLALITPYEAPVSAAPASAVPPP